MKIILLFLTLGLLAVASCFERDSKHVTQSNTDIVEVLVDHTDTFLSLPNVNGISKLYAIENDHSKGAVFKLGEIEDIEFTPITQFAIEPQSLLMQNPGERETTIKAFFANINSAFVKLQSEPSEKPLSEIYPVVAREANSLAAMSGNRTLVVYSDLGENTPALSVYRNSFQEKMRNNPNAVAEQFQGIQPLNNLTGLTIYLVYRARNYEDSRLFSLVSSLYVKMFSAKGAAVIITAKL